MESEKLAKNEEQKQTFSRDFKKIFPVLLVGKLFIAVACIFVWIGTFYSLGEDKLLIVLFSSVSLVFAILLFIADFHLLNKLYKIGKINKLEWITILNVLAVFFLYLFPNAPGFIFLAGYYISILAAEVMFFKGKRLI